MTEKKLDRTDVALIIGVSVLLSSVRLVIWLLLVSLLVLVYAFLPVWVFYTVCAISIALLAYQSYGKYRAEYVALSGED